MDIRNHKESKDIKNNKSALGAAAAIMGIIGSGYGIYSSIKNEGRDEYLMNLQHDLNLDTFDKTGYSAQVNQMKNAGLNPALMYGMGSGGNPQIGNSSISNKDEDVKLAKMAMGLQSMDLASQIKYRESEADLNKAKSDEIRGIDKELKETTAKLNESIASLNTATEELNKLKYELEKTKTETEIKKMTVDAANIIADTALKQFELNFMQETADDNKKKLREEINKLVFEQLRIQSQIMVDKSSAKLNYKKVEELNFKMNELYNLELKNYNLKLKEHNFNTDKFNKEYSLNFEKFKLDALINDNKGSILPSWAWRRLKRFDDNISNKFRISNMEGTSEVFFYNLDEKIIESIWDGVNLNDNDEEDVELKEVIEFLIEGDKKQFKMKLDR